MIEFRLPDVGEGLDEAEVIRWLVAAGERVARDQPIVEIQTDKALVEIPSPASGTMAQLAADAGAIVKVGELLFVLDADAGEEHGGTGAADAAREKEEARAAETGAPLGETGGAVHLDDPESEERARREASWAAGGSAPAGPHRVRPRAAPAVRRLATELGIDLTVVKGSGPGGRVVAEDVRRAVDTAASGAEAIPVDELAPRRAAADAARAATTVGDSAGADAKKAEREAARAEPPGPPRTLGQARPGRIPIAGVRRVIAQTMSKAWSTIPHIHSHDELDALALVDAVRGLRRRAGERGALYTMSVFFVLAAARALRRFPLVNASIDLERHEIVIHEDVNVGLAVATPVGLIVPVILGADLRSLDDLAAEIDRLARAARDRKVTPEELRGGTFTVTNFGSLGGRFASPIIRPPEVGILGFGAIRERPWVVQGRVEPRPVLPISFGADHRLVDGDLAVAFQEHVRELLSDPVQLLLGE